MARMNFDAKIEMLEAKIEKKTNDLKKLKEELEDVKERKMKTAYKELLEYMSENDITKNAGKPLALAMGMDRRCRDFA